MYTVLQQFTKLHHLVANRYEGKGVLGSTSTSCNNSSPKSSKHSSPQKTNILFSKKTAALIPREELLSKGTITTKEVGPSYLPDDGLGIEKLSGITYHGKEPQGVQVARALLGMPSVLQVIDRAQVHQRLRSPDRGLANCLKDMKKDFIPFAAINKKMSPEWAVHASAGLLICLGLGAFVDLIPDVLLSHGYMLALQEKLEGFQILYSKYNALLGLAAERAAEEGSEHARVILEQGLATRDGKLDDMAAVAEEIRLEQEIVKRSAALLVGAILLTVILTAKVSLSCE